MKQIDLEPSEYRESGRARIIRSILHKPVFMTISTVLGVLCTAPWFLGGFISMGWPIPDWTGPLSFAPWVLAVCFAVFAIVMDDDRVARERSQVAQPTPVEGQAPAWRIGAQTAKSPAKASRPKR